MYQVHYFLSSSHSHLSNMHSVPSLLPPPTALHVVAIDLPGHGRSSHRPPGAFYHIQNYIADVKYVIDGKCRDIDIHVAQAFGCSVCSSEMEEVFFPSTLNG